jgi:hypothetical protein
VPSPRDRDLLDFESRWNGHSAAKEEAIARDLAMTPARYYQLLERVIDNRMPRSTTPCWCTACAVCASAARPSPSTAPPRAQERPVAFWGARDAAAEGPLR